MERVEGWVRDVPCKMMSNVGNIEATCWNDACESIQRNAEASLFFLLSHWLGSCVRSCHKG